MLTFSSKRSRCLSRIFLSAVLFSAADYRNRDSEVASPFEENPKPSSAAAQPSAPPQDADLRYLSPRAGVPQQSRALTAGEERLARALFGDKIDLSSLYLRFYKKEQAGLVSDVTNGNHHNIEIYGTRYFSSDYSQELGAELFGAFVHEITAIMQNQHALAHADIAGFTYLLDSKWSFKDYGVQQQRAVMTDYALRFLHPTRQSTWLPHVYGDDRSDTDPVLMKLVEDAFPPAAAARAAFRGVHTRTLTPGEIKLVKAIFGDQINTAIVRIHREPQEYSDYVAMVFSAHDVHFYGPGHASADYSQETDAFRFGTFVHEMTHIWQFQSNWLYSQNFSTEYFYPLETQWNFASYGYEQQAAMVEDYARLHFHSSAQMHRLSQTYNGQALMARLPLLNSHVEAQFPTARKSRTGLQARTSRSLTTVAHARHPG